MNHDMMRIAPMIYRLYITRISRYMTMWSLPVFAIVIIHACIQHCSLRNSHLRFLKAISPSGLTEKNHKFSNKQVHLITSENNTSQAHCWFTLTIQPSVCCWRIDQYLFFFSFFKRHRQYVRIHMCSALNSTYIFIIYLRIHFNTLLLIGAGITKNAQREQNLFLPLKFPTAAHARIFFLLNTRIKIKRVYVCALAFYEKVRCI